MTKIIVQLAGSGSICRYIFVTHEKRNRKDQENRDCHLDAAVLLLCDGRHHGRALAKAIASLRLWSEHVAQ